MIERDSLRRYAAMVVDAGLGIRHGSRLHVVGELPHRDFMRVIAEEAYARGASRVWVEYYDERLVRTRVDRVHEDFLDEISEVVRVESEAMVKEDWSLLRIAGYEDASVMEGADTARMSRLQRAHSQAGQVLRDAQMASRLAWCVIAAPTEAWARTVLGPAGTAEDLWKVLVPVLRLDAPDPGAAQRGHMAALAERATMLTAKRFSSLRFEAPGTDLVVGLSPSSRWLGGGDTTPDGRPFLPNIPTEEVFTTPDWRRTNGVVTATRRARIHGIVVEGARVEFRDGVVTSSSAARGASALAQFLDTDPGARRLGEVALVDCGSPIWQSGMVFDSMLFDENASCHVALAAGYDLGMDGGDREGLNVSYVHEDFMIGSEELSVTATDQAGTTIPLIVKGRFA